MSAGTISWIVLAVAVGYSIWIAFCYHLALWQRRRWGLYSFTVGVNGNIAFEVHMHRLVTFRNPYKLYGVGPWTKQVTKEV